MLLLVGVLVFGGSALAAEQDPNTNVAYLTTDAVANAAKAVGFEAFPPQDLRGQQAVRILSKTGHRILAVLAECKTPNHCRGLQLVVVFNGQLPLERLNRFNERHLFTSAIVIGAKVNLVRYEIADYGIPIGNIMSDLTNLDRIADALKRCIETDACE